MKFYLFLSTSHFFAKVFHGKCLIMLSFSDPKSGLLITFYIPYLPVASPPPPMQVRRILYNPVSCFLSAFTIVNTLFFSQYTPLKTMN